MTAQDHNKALTIIYCLVGTLCCIPIFASPWIIASNVDDYPSMRRADQILIATVVFFIVLGLALLLLSTAYGLYRKKSWARTSALVFAVLIIWSFPLGTALGIYTWWFLHSEGGKGLYGKINQPDSIG